MPDSAYIYGLLCPLDNKIKYVGRSLEPVRRYDAHIKSSLGWHSHHDTPKVRWIQRLDAEGLRPKLVILEVLEGLEFGAFSYGRHPKLKEAELRWTKRLLSEGHPLINHERYQGDKEARDAQSLDDALKLGRRLFG